MGLISTFFTFKLSFDDVWHFFGLATALATFLNNWVIISNVLA
jgi:hypothetical protein